MSVFSQHSDEYPASREGKPNLKILSEEFPSVGVVRDMSSELNLSLPQAQEIICHFFLDQVKNSPPASVLEHFKQFFIEPIFKVNSKPHQALAFIATVGSCDTFLDTLKRSIYILVNNWSTARRQPYILQLVQLLATASNGEHTSSITVKRLQRWCNQFVNSQEYKDLQLFTAKYSSDRSTEHWSRRYSSYLLVAQSTDVKKPLEQQEAARRRARQLKEQFKLELAMYTARSSSTRCPSNSAPNPTRLGEQVLLLIEKILSQRGRFGYVSLARIFIGQVRHSNYAAFKQSFLKYLWFSFNEQELHEVFKTQLASQLTDLYENYHDKPWSPELLLRTCSRVIEYLTIINPDTPSPLFLLLATQGKTLTLAILLLKIVLICPAVRTHLDCCLAQLVHYYEHNCETKCQWLIDFLEVLQVSLTIYTENVKYNLVNMPLKERELSTSEQEHYYRIFSQMKPRRSTAKKAA